MKLDRDDCSLSAGYNLGGGAFYGIAFDGEPLWVSCYERGLVNVQATLPVDSTPVGLAFEGSSVWVTLLGADAVTKLALREWLRAVRSLSKGLSSGAALERCAGGLEGWQIRRSFAKPPLAGDVGSPCGPSSLAPSSGSRRQPCPLGNLSQSAPDWVPGSLLETG